MHARLSYDLFNYQVSGQLFSFLLRIFLGGLSFTLFFLGVFFFGCLVFVDILCLEELESDTLVLFENLVDHELAVLRGVLKVQLRLCLLVQVGEFIVTVLDGLEGVRNFPEVDRS